MSRRKPYTPPPRPTVPDPCPECRTIPGCREMARHFVAPPAPSAKPGSPGVPTIVIAMARCDCPRGATMPAYPLHSDLMTRWAAMPGHVSRTSAARPRLLDDERYLPSELAKRTRLAIPPLRRGMHPAAAERPRVEDGRQASIFAAPISSEPDIETTTDSRPHWTDRD